MAGTAYRLLSFQLAILGYDTRNNLMHYLT